MKFNGKAIRLNCAATTGSHRIGENKQIANWATCTRPSKNQHQDMNMLIKWLSRGIGTPIKTLLIWTSNTYSDLCIVLHTICRKPKSNCFFCFPECVSVRARLCIWKFTRKKRQATKRQTECDSREGKNETAIDRQLNELNRYTPLFESERIRKIVNEIESHAKWNDTKKGPPKQQQQQHKYIKNYVLRWSIRFECIVFCKLPPQKTQNQMTKAKKARAHTPSFGLFGRSFK